MKMQYFFPQCTEHFLRRNNSRFFFDIMDLTYVGNNVLSSAVCMDKVTANDIFASNGILQPKYYLVTKYEFEKDREKQIKNILETIGENSFVKPCNAGSSVGVTKVNKKEEIIPLF